MKRKVLILGDGNFSFSLCILTRFQKDRVDLDDIEATCTSFDSQEEVAEKYPEAMSTLQRLGKLDNCRVLHSINATTLPKALQGALFDEVIFNFPHLGVEDLHRHRVLVAHFLHSAMECLSSNGIISIALSADQARNWQLFDSAERFSLLCIGSIPIVASHWAGYELKRHHTGRSFATKVQSLFHYTFTRRDHAPRVSLLEALHKAATKGTDTPGSSNAVNSAHSSTSPPQLAKESKSKKRVHLLVEGRYSAEDSLFVCKECAKSFPTEQGVRTHVYNVHVLASEKRITGDDVEDSVARCEECGRVCPNEESLKQHILARHTGQHLHILPYWKQNKDHNDDIEDSKCEEAEDRSRVENEGSGCYHCPICLQKLASEEELKQHIDSGIEPISPEDNGTVEFRCHICSKKFSQKRALLQHENYCSVRNGVRGGGGLVSDVT